MGNKRFMVVQTHRGGQPFYWRPTTYEWVADQDKGKVYKQHAAAERAADMYGGVVLHIEAPAPKNDTDPLREALAAYAHDYAWSRWMRYEFGKCTPNPDGSLTIPAWAVERWTRQMNTAYADLPEEECESDRRQADKIINIIAALAVELAD